MTVLKYIVNSKICNTAELLSLKRENQADWDIIQRWAREEMEFNKIPIEEK